MNLLIKLPIKQRTWQTGDRIRQITKSIALAAVVSMAATAGPAVAGSLAPLHD